MGRHSKLEALTAQERAAILEGIRAGAFPHVAGKAFGISPPTWWRWMDQGERGIEPYAEWYSQVVEAAAQARLAAEVTVRAEEPLAWLKHGPGRQRSPDDPGWSADQTVVAPQVNIEVKMQVLELFAAEIRNMPPALRDQVVVWLRERRRQALAIEVEAVRREVDAQEPRALPPPAGDGEGPIEKGGEQA